MLSIRIKDFVIMPAEEIHHCNIILYRTGSVMYVVSILTYA